MAFKVGEDADKLTDKEKKQLEKQFQKGVRELKSDYKKQKEIGEGSEEFAKVAAGNRNWLALYLVRMHLDKRELRKNIFL